MYVYRWTYVMLLCFQYSICLKLNQENLWEVDNQYNIQ